MTIVPNPEYNNEQYKQYGEEVDFLPEMTIGQALKIHLFGMNKWSRMALLATIAKVMTFILKTFPSLATGFIVADDVFIPGLGALDDPGLIVSVPLMILNIAWITIRVSWIRHKANKPIREQRKMIKAQGRYQKPYFQ